MNRIGKKEQIFVFFVGKRFSGQDYMCQMRYRSYKRVNFSFMMKKYENMGSKECLECLFLLLDKSSNVRRVIFDDPLCFQKAEERKELFTKLKEFNPSLKIVVHQFLTNPQLSTSLKTIPIWRSQFLLAERYLKLGKEQALTSSMNFGFLSNEEKSQINYMKKETLNLENEEEVYSKDLFSSSEDLSFFSPLNPLENTKIEPVSENENFDQLVADNEVPLLINRNAWEFNNNGLFIDSSKKNVFEGKEKEWKEFFLEWIKYSGQFGRVIVFADVKEKMEIVSNIQRLQIPYPIYFCFWSTQKKNKETLMNEELEKNGGIFAFLMYFFSLDLKRCYFINDNFNNLQIASKNCGMNTILKSDLFKKDTEIDEKIFKRFHRKENQEFKFLNDLPEYNSSFKDHFLEPIKVHPLISELFTSTNSLEKEKGKFVKNYSEMNVTNDGVKTTLGLLFEKNLCSAIVRKLENGNEYQDYYEAYNSRELSKNLGVLSFGKTREIDAQNKFSEFNTKDFFNYKDMQEGEEEEKKDNSEKGKKMRKLTVDEIISYFGVVFFQRGRDYYNEDKIYDVQKEEIEDETTEDTEKKEKNENFFKILSKCRGGRTIPYDQETIIENGRIIESKCSCPMKNDCKHCCAQILAYFHIEKGVTNYQAGTRKINPKPFADLNPLNMDWCIRGKVTKIYPVRTYVTNELSGKVCSIVMEDDCGNPEDEYKDEIRLVLFNDVIDELLRKFHVDCVYCVSRGHLRPVNHNYCNNPNARFDVILQKDSIVRQLSFLKFKKQKQIIFQEEFAKRMNKSSNIKFVEYKGENFENIDTLINEFATSTNQQLKSIIGKNTEGETRINPKKRKRDEKTDLEEEFHYSYEDIEERNYEHANPSYKKAVFKPLPIPSYLKGKRLIKKRPRKRRKVMKNSMIEVRKKRNKEKKKKKKIEVIEID